MKFSFSFFLRQVKVGGIGKLKRWMDGRKDGIAKKKRMKESYNYCCCPVLVLPTNPLTRAYPTNLQYDSGFFSRGIKGAVIAVQNVVMTMIRIVINLEFRFWILLRRRKGEGGVERRGKKGKTYEYTPI